MGNKRKQHSAEFKAQVAMAAVSGDKPLAELASEYVVQPAAPRLLSARSDRYKTRKSQNHLSGSGLSLFHPGGCPSYRDHRKLSIDFRESGF